MTKVLVVILSAVCGGLLLNYLNVPAGAMVGSMLGTAAAQFLTNVKIKIPAPARRFIRIIMGCYIGLGITFGGIMELKNIAGAVAIMVTGVTVITLSVVYILHRFCKLGLKEAFLSALPAGLSEIGMNSEDFKVDPIPLTTVHLMRMITILTLIPLVLKLLNK